VSITLSSRRLGLAAALTASTALVIIATPAKADDYTDLLGVLRDRGSIGQAEYQSLLARHNRGARTPAGRRAQEAALRGGGGAESAAAAAQQAAAAAAASAAAAQASMEQARTMMESPEIAHATPYMPGKGMGIRVGQIDLNFSGFINAYYTYSSAGKGGGPDGGLTDASGFDSSAVRTGLLPAALIFKASTTQAGIDLAAVFGIYPGINSSATTIGANTGGLPIGLGTSGIDFRQIYVTAGTKTAGTFKFGRDLGIFGSDAILSDATLLSVGATGSNANPGNTSLGRIGYGYIYADWIPQISYASPIWGGFQFTVGVFQPFREFNFSGDSGSADAHSVPMFQGKVTYDYKFGNVAGRVWVSGLYQQQQNITGTDFVGDKTRQAVAGDAGVKADIGPFGAVAYYYRAQGVGTTALFFDGVAPNGQTRPSEGWYFQGSFKATPKLKLVASYGTSNLYRATDEVLNPNLVARNTAYIGAAYYSLTDWLTLVGEYAHTHSGSHGGATSDANAFTAGGIVFF
jgi:hypothetical protein